MSLKYEPSSEPLQEFKTYPIGHTADYDPFIKSQLAQTQLTLGPYAVQIWSRNARIFEGTKPSCPTEQEFKTYPIGHTADLLLLLYYAQAQSWVINKSMGLKYKPSTLNPDAGVPRPTPSSCFSVRVYGWWCGVWAPRSSPWRSLSSRLKDLLGPVTRVKKKKREANTGVN